MSGEIGSYKRAMIAPIDKKGAYGIIDFLFHFGDINRIIEKKPPEKIPNAKAHKTFGNPNTRPIKAANLISPPPRSPGLSKAASKNMKKPILPPIKCPAIDESGRRILIKSAATTVG